MPQSSWAGCIAGSETFFGRLQWEIVRTLRHRGLRKSYALAMSRFQILGTAAGGLTLHAMSLFPEPRRDGCVMVRLHWGICRNVFFFWFFGGWLEFEKNFHHLSSSICIIFHQLSSFLKKSFHFFRYLLYLGSAIYDAADLWGLWLWAPGPRPPRNHWRGIHHPIGSIGSMVYMLTFGVYWW